MIKCEKCKFFTSWDGEEGTCHRFPPMRHQGIVDSALNYSFPKVNKWDWCGEHRFQEVEKCKS